MAQNRGHHVSTLIDQDDLRTERAQERADRLEADIRAACKRALNGKASDRETEDACTEVAVLIRRRSTTQLLKLEFERQARGGA